MDTPKFTEKQEMVIRLLADGMTLDECAEIMTSDPQLVPAETMYRWLRDVELLKAVIARTNDLIGQAWGTMWQAIKRNAMLGSTPHSKLLIEYVQNGKRLPDQTLRLIFDKAVAGQVDEQMNGDS